MRLPVVAALMVLTLSACSLSPTTLEEASNSVIVQSDPYTGMSTYKSALLTLKPSELLDPSFALGRLALTQGKEAETGCLYVMYDAKDWAFLDKAFDIEQQQHEVSVIARKVSTLGVTEEVCVKLDRKYFESHAATGINLKVMGERGSIAFVVPGFVVQGFLSQLPVAISP